MTDQPKDAESMGFEDIELKSDIPVHRLEKGAPPLHRRASEPKSSSKWPVVLSLLLFVGAAAAAGHFFLELAKLRDRHQQLQQQQSQVNESLGDTTSSLEEARRKVETLTNQLAEARKSNTSLQGRVQNLDRQQAETAKTVSGKDQVLQKLTTERDQLKTRVTNLEKDLKTRSGALEQARVALSDAREKHELEQNVLNEQLTAQEMQYKVNLQKLETQAKQLERQVKGLEREKKEMGRMQKEEASASLQIIEDNKKLKGQVARLENEMVQVRQSLRDRTAERDQAVAAQGVSTGKLVPNSQEVSGLNLSFQEPLPSDVRWPRRQGPILVRALVSETGRVEKAYIAKGQEVDGELSRALMQAVYKYKFTPPTLQGKRVKTWHTFLVDPR
ncbi:Energy transducer TonB [Sulfidibacter corallicola]|uniref:Energy transducer TonB n=1 Tax=Sulfidibacter corallicola TaxID=2818388 RepID=A0A8A4TUI0_SULCO|nr:energy transducer TonB [Sulfidibacter corallicola]QTD53626.1 energy transducer TonB [Sulfidibacter corallicola]